jgi:hypothetical protein
LAVKKQATVSQKQEIFFYTVIRLNGSVPNYAEWVTPPASAIVPADPLMQYGSTGNMAACGAEAATTEKIME